MADNANKPLKLPPGAKLISQGSTPIDYDALAKQYGATSSQASSQVDYDALAKQHGALDNQSKGADPWDRYKTSSPKLPTGAKLVSDGAATPEQGPWTKY